MEPDRSYKNTYIDGNTVRKLETAPQRRKRPVEREDRRLQEPHRRREKQKKANQRIAMRNREKAAKLSLGYTLFLGIAVIAALAASVFYLNLQNMLSQKNHHITSLKSELNTLTAANVAAAERLNSSINLEQVFKIATEELGMSYATQNQVIFYSNTDEDYVRQYQGIPK